MKGANGGIIPAGPPVEGVYNIDRVRAHEDLREVVGMNCEQLPMDVRDALHQIPEIEKQHRCALNPA